MYFTFFSFYDTDSMIIRVHVHIRTGFFHFKHTDDMSCNMWVCIYKITFIAATVAVQQVRRVSLVL